MNIFAKISATYEVFMQISRSSRLLLRYGLFAVLSQLSLMLVYIDVASATFPPSLLSYRFAPWLEYPLTTIALLLGGAYLIEWIQKNEV